jgi:hypothetical protein
VTNDKSKRPARLKSGALRSWEEIISGAPRFSPYRQFVICHLLFVISLASVWTFAW